MVTVQKFNGIHYLSYFKNVNNKCILLCGEMHDRTGVCVPCFQNEKCINIDNFIKKMVQDTEICLDFFLESNYVNKKNLEKVYLLDKSESSERQTIGISRLKWKKDKLYHQLRIHHFDIRQYQRKFLMFKIFYFPERYFKNKMSTDRHQKATEILKYQTNYNYYVLYRFWYNFFINPDIINKYNSSIKTNPIYQYYVNCGLNIKQEELDVINYLKAKISKRYVNTLFYQKYHTVEQFYNYFIKIHIKSRANRDPLFKQFLQEWNDKRPISVFSIKEGFKTLINLYMDLYLILRLFKTFTTDSDKITRSQIIGCELPKYINSKYIVIYAGSRHTIFYSDFISNYFNIHPDINKMSENECVILDTPTIFF
jgi:hypothetical protein